MRVAILGAGAQAFGCAALLMERGHQPVLWSPSGASTAAFRDGAPLTSEGKIEGSFAVSTAQSCAEAMAGAQLVLVALPANGHRRVFDEMAAALQPTQIVAISSHASLGAYYLIKRLVAHGTGACVAAFNTTILRSRRTSPTRVRVATLRKAVDVAVVPQSACAKTLALLADAFGERFRPVDGLLSIALGNVNPQSHMALALCNFTRMEKGEAWGQSDNLTASVGRLLEGLDAERLAVANAAGVTVRSMRQHYSLTYGVPDAPLEETARQLAAQPNPQAGPTTIDTRYTLEDVPFGLVPMVALGGMVGVATPLHAAGLSLFGALYGRDFSGENDLLPALETTSLKDLLDLEAQFDGAGA
jgi:opine dehydrogenase